MRSLVRSQLPSSPFNGLQAAVNDLFENFNDGSESLATWPRVQSLEAFSPRIDVTENDKSITVTADLPGVDEKDVEVSLANDVLTLRGEKKTSSEEKGSNWYRSERTYGSFMRSIPLPCEVDPEKVQAASRKGVLTVTLGKSSDAKTKTRRIEVKST